MSDWKTIVEERLAGLKLDTPQEADIVDELAQHIEDRYEELRAEGTSEEEARRLALEGLDENLIQELQRARRAAFYEPPSYNKGGFVRFSMYDLKMAVRTAKSKPAFSLMVIGMLALGIAGNAAIFSLFNGLFLKALPFYESERLVDLDETAPKWNLHYVGVSNADFYAWRKDNRAFERMAFFDTNAFNLSGLGTAQRIRGASVTLDLLDVLKLKPVLGRNFLPDEDKPKGAKVALLGYDLWQRLFHGDRSVLGRTIILSEQAYNVVGVLPKEAVFPDQTDLWVPLAADPNESGGWYLNGIGRLKPGVSTEQAASDLLRVHKAIITTHKANESGITSPILTPLRDRYLGDYRTVSRVLLVAVAVVLLIACVNIAALMLVRATARGREIAIRTAIGASRNRILGQLLMENALLAATGGIVGVLVGRVFLRAMVSWLPENTPRWISFTLDARFVIFCVLITGAAALLFGLVPAIQASSGNSGSALHESSTRTSLSRGRRRTLSALVVCEIGLALMLLISAGLLLQAFHKVLHADPGFRPENVISFRVDLPTATYPKPDKILSFYQNLLSQVRVLPGVQAAGVASAPPLGGHWGNFYVGDEDRPLGPNDKSPVVLQVVATLGYFDAIGMTRLAGRPFDERDGLLKDAPVVIVNESFAKMHWPGKSALGKRVRYNNPKSTWMQVVGIYRDEKHYGLDQEVRPSVFQPYPQIPYRSMSIVLRSSGDQRSLVEPARQILRRMDADLPMYDVRTMTERLERSLWARRAYSWLFGAFALVALILAAAGIYGVISYAVTQRTREIGIRMALGATPRKVLGGVLRSGMALVAIGAALGLTATLLAARLLETLLFGVSPRDPLIYAAVILGVACVGLLANFVPARRAAAVDPMLALRVE
jgi:predicted permease